MTCSNEVEVAPFHASLLATIERLNTLTAFSATAAILMLGEVSLSPDAVSSKQESEIVQDNAPRSPTRDSVVSDATCFRSLPHDCNS